MTCQQKGCDNDATHICYWPNQITRQCWEHAQKVKQLGAFIGVNVPILLMTEEDKEA